MVCGNQTWSGPASGLALATMVLVTVLGGTILAVDSPAGVPPGRQARMTRGINLSNWFAPPPESVKENQDPANMAKDLALIKAMGFRHVRLAFSEETVADKETPTTLNPEKMKRFDAALDMLLPAGIAVVADFSASDQLKAGIQKDDAAVEDFAKLWRALAKHLSSRDPEMIYFEVLNEPVMSNSARWNVIQKKVLAAMREAAPRHTLIATSAEWSEIYKLPETDVVADRNVAYNVHCYEPVRFTHQDAPWVAGDWVKGLTNVPYPSSPEIVATVMKDQPHENARNLLLNYGKERWNAAKIDAVIADGGAWAKKHGVFLTCNEFGVYRKAPAADRNRCIEDTRKALEKYGIGWCVWDLASVFGVTTGGPGKRVPDLDTLKALGLTYDH